MLSRSLEKHPLAITISLWTTFLLSHQSCSYNTATLCHTISLWKWEFLPFPTSFSASLCVSRHPPISVTRLLSLTLNADTYSVLFSSSEKLRWISALAPPRGELDLLERPGETALLLQQCGWAGSKESQALWGGTLQKDSKAEYSGFCRQRMYSWAFPQCQVLPDILPILAPCFRWRPVVSLFIWAAPYSPSPLELMPTGLLLLSSLSIRSFLPFRCTTGSVHKDLQGSGKWWAGFGEGRYHHGYAEQQWWWAEWTMPVLNCNTERTEGFLHLP